MRQASAVAAPAARLPLACDRGTVSPLPLWLAADAFGIIGWGTKSSFQAALALLATGCLFSHVWFLRRDDTAQTAQMGRHESTVDNQRPCRDF